MATNTGKGSRIGSVRSRSQVSNPLNKNFTERNDKTGRFTRQKEDGKPFKGVAKEPDRRK